MTRVANGHLPPCEQPLEEFSWTALLSFNSPLRKRGISRVNVLPHLRVGLVFCHGQKFGCSRIGNNSGNHENPELLRVRLHDWDPKTKL